MPESLCECGHPKAAHPMTVPAPPWRDPCKATIHVGIGTHKHPAVYSYPCPCPHFIEQADE